MFAPSTEAYYYNVKYTFYGADMMIYDTFI